MIIDKFLYKRQIKVWRLKNNGKSIQSLRHAAHPGRHIENGLLQTPAETYGHRCAAEIRDETKK